jgi:F-type H+-transporting ATPase subunit b
LKGRAFLLAMLLTCVLWGEVGARAASPRLALAWAAAPEQGEPAKQAAEDQHDLIFKIINFAILVVALGYLLRKPAAEFFAQRSQGIRKALDEGRAALQKSQAQLSAVEEKLNRLEEEIGAFKTAAEKEMQSERARMAEEAAHEAEKILEAARVRIDSATRAAKLELKTFTARHSLDLAEQMIQARLDDATRQRLVGRFVATLGAAERRN